MNMLLQPAHIGGLRLANRIVFAPHATGLAGELGQVSDELLAYYARRARGGAGLIEIASVHAATAIDGYKLASRELRIDDDSFLGGLFRLTEAVHREGSRIGIQMTPGPGALVGGNLAYKRPRLWNPGSAIEPVSPAGVAISSVAARPRVLSMEEIKRLVELMGQGAHRAWLAGFDLIEIAAENAYLIGQFLWPDFNRRTDEYGGSLENRLRFLLEIVERIRDATAGRIPVTVRYNIGEYSNDAVPEDRQYIAEAQRIARILSQSGIDAIHVCVSGSGLGPKETLVPPMHVPEDGFVPFAEAVKNVVGIPVILTGRMRDPDLAEQVLREGKADFIGMARPLMADPDLPRKVAGGKILEIRNCIACSECMRNSTNGLPIRCTLNAVAGREREYDTVPPAPTPKKVMIIGAGPAGLEAARVAALRGHQVMLVEKERHLGYRLDLIARLPYRRPFTDVVAFYKTAFQQLRSNIEVLLGNEVTPDVVYEMEKENELPDVVVIATGGSPLIPMTAGGGPAPKIPLDVLESEEVPGQRAIVLGANIACCEVALLLARQGKTVTLVETPACRLGMDIDGREAEYRIWAGFVRPDLVKYGVRIINDAVLESVSDNTVVLTANGRREQISADFVVAWPVLSPADALARFFAGKAGEVYVIGDASRPAKIREAIYDGFATASRI